MPTPTDDLLRKLEPILKDKTKDYWFQGWEMMIRDLSHLDFKIVNEWTEYFRDMLNLKEKLQEAKGELNLERFKKKLID